jgi:transposase
MAKSLIKAAIRYSEAFKVQVVRELETGKINIDQICRKYGIGGRASIRHWLAKYGNGTVGKVIRVQKPEEIDELKRLKERVRKLETALADANLDLALERAYTHLACERAGIRDVTEFKKKAAGPRGTAQ